MSLRARLLLLVLAVLVPTAGLFLWIVAATYLRETESAHQRLRETTRALALLVDRELDKRAAIARTLGASVAIAEGDFRRFYDEAKAATLDTGSWVVLVDEQDQLLNTSVPFGTALPKRSWQPDRPLVTGAPVVSNLRIGPVAKRPILAVFAPERSFTPTRYNVGVVFTPSALQTIMDDQRLPDGWVAAVIDREHSIVARTPAPERWMGRPEQPDLNRALAERPDGFIESVSLDGVQVLAFFSRSPQHGWTFVMGVPRAALTTAAQRAAWESAIAAALLGAFALGLALLAARAIRAPIDTLQRDARLLENKQIPPVRRTGLAEADAVSAALHRAGQRSGEINAALEQRNEALRHNQHSLERHAQAQQLIVALHDATRGLHDPARLQSEVVERVGRHFGVSRCTFAEIDASGQFADVAHDFADGVESVVGRHRLDAFGPAAIAELRAGRTLVIDDVRLDPRTCGPDSAPTFAAVDVRSLICVPLLKESRVVALLVLNHREPRVWQPDEAALLEQVAERVWFALANTRAEAALRESRDVLALAMRGGRMGAWSRDLATEHVWWSRELEELFGLPPGGFAGTTPGFRSLVHPDDQATVDAAVGAAVRGQQEYSIEFRFRHASGDWRWMEGRGRAVYDAAGRPTMLYGLGVDITRRKQADDELRRLNAELSEADRRKDEFLATLAHELRNPLAPITHALEVLRLKDPVDADTRWSRDIIERQIRHLTRLVDDLLDLARISRGKVQLRRERIDLAAVLHGALEAARPLIDAQRHTVALVLPDEPLPVDADAIRLTQVVLNLLNNAVKYTPPGGQITLAAERGAGELLIKVRDSGIGIAREHLSGVFEMFSQVAPALERSQGGLGIGLALARGLVELHGGMISAHSEGPGRGSEFVVHLLPAAIAGAGAPAHADDGAAPPSGRRRVLIVDDNRDAADSLALMLSLSGHETHAIYDGAAALELAARFMPDVVLLDIGMPELNGYEVAERLRRLPWGHRVVLIALTGWGQDEDRRRALAAGFDHHLTKPVDPQRLATLLGAGAAG